MAITAEDWMKEIEDAIVSHIKDSLASKSEDADIYIEREIVRPFSKPVISINFMNDEEEPTGGMNVYSETEQAWWHTLEYFITVNTDNNTGQKTKRNKLGSILSTIAFEQRRHLLLTAINGNELTFRPRGNLSGGMADGTWYQSHFNLTIKLEIPFTSLVL